MPAAIAGATQDGVAVTRATLVTGVEVDRRPGVAAIGRHEELAAVFEVRDGDALRRTREADVGPRPASRLAMDSRPRVATVERSPRAPESHWPGRR